MWSSAVGGSTFVSGARGGRLWVTASVVRVGGGDGSSSWWFDDGIVKCGCCFVGRDGFFIIGVGYAVLNYVVSRRCLRILLQF